MAPTRGPWDPTSGTPLMDLGTPSQTDGTPQTPSKRRKPIVNEIILKRWCQNRNLWEKDTGKRGVTWWGVTTHQASWADGLCKYCKGLPHPAYPASLMSCYTPTCGTKSQTSFPQIFQWYLWHFSTIFFDWPIFSNRVSWLGIAGEWIVHETGKCRTS